jgi:hypothetical protein
MAVAARSAVRLKLGVVGVPAAAAATGPFAQTGPQVGLWAVTNNS